MEGSFGVCWDTVHPGAWTDDDETAVVEHGAVMYALTGSLAQAATLPAAIDAVLFAEHLLGNGATAVKIESSGVAHGVARWRELAAQLRAARDAGDRAAVARIARIAVTKRPLGGAQYYESLGNHLVGLPEVYVPNTAVRTDRDAVALMDLVADELAADGVEAVLARRAKLDMTSSYEGGFEFKINPYGHVQLPKTRAIPALRPSRPGL
jgi:hypothetical protein